MRPTGSATGTAVCSSASVTPPCGREYSNTCWVRSCARISAYIKHTDTHEVEGVEAAHRAGMVGR